MENASPHVTEQSLTAKDGTTIGYKVTGSGPAILIISGAYRAGRHYLKMAGYMAPNFTLYIIDRRGRGQSGPQGNNYSLQTEIDDAIAILEKHNIEYVFGHSYGGLVALNLALQYPLKKLASYEPGLSINNSLPLGWVPKFEKLVQKEDYVGAMVALSKGLEMASFFNYVPGFVLRGLFKMLSKQNKNWDEDKLLLNKVPAEIRAGVKYESDIERYRDIHCPVLLVGGSKTPKWLTDASKTVSKIIPGAQYIEMEGMIHNAPDEFGPEKVAEVLNGFFLS